MGVKRYWGIFEAKDFKGPAASLLSLFNQIGQAATETGLPHSHYSELLEQLGAWWRALDSGSVASWPSHQHIQYYTEHTGPQYIYMYEGFHFNMSPQFVGLFLSKKSYFTLSWYTWIRGGGIARQNHLPLCFI